MTLGDIFAKLSGVPLLSIVKWYGRIIMWTFFGAVVLGVLTGIVLLIVAVVVNVPWYFTAGIVLFLSAWAALKYADPEFFKSDFDKSMDRLNQEILMAQDKKKAVNTTPVDNWAQVREVVSMMTEDQACNIAMYGKSYHFETRQEALDFLDGNSTAEPFL